MSSIQAPMDAHLDADTIITEWLYIPCQVNLNATNL